MFEAELNSNASSIEVKFSCIDCGENIVEELSIPLPDFDTDKDTHSATRSDSFDTILCPDCGKEYNVQLISSILGSWIYINDLPDNYDVSILDDDEPELLKYTLMHKDIAVADIEIDVSTGSITRILGIQNKEHLPPRAARSREDFKAWWSDRAIPKTRKELRHFLASRNIRSCGNYLVDNLGLSLIDCYWIKPYEKELYWKDVNLFTNPFQNSMLAKRERGESTGFSSYSFSPDASTGGDLPKWWIIDNDIRYLVKGNDGGSTQQSRNEILASLIHKSQRFSNYVDYSLVKIPDDRLGCRCAAFTSETAEFISAWDLIGKSKFSKSESFRMNFINECVKGGLDRDSVIAQLDYMALTDFIISNSDRHLNNFGILRNPDTLKFISLAPLFDSGNSMLYKYPEKITLAAALREKINTFYDNYRASVEHIENINCVDLSKMPTMDDVIKIYADDILLHSIADNLGRLYSAKIEFVRQLQQGKSYYDVASSYGISI